MVNIALAGLFMVLFLGLFKLQIVEGRKFRQLSQKNCIRLLSQEGSRGRILDREGKVIVASEISYELMLMPQELNQQELYFNTLSRILGRPAQELKDNFRKGYIAPSLPVVIVRNLNAKQAIALEEFRPDLPGLVIHPQPRRSYPYGKLAANVIGYVNEIDRWRLTKLEDYGYKTRDIVGFGGVEEKYDYYLRQEEGGLSVEVDYRGRLVRMLGFMAPRNGKDIQLTINLEIQKIVDDSLEGKKGCAVVMDPYSGEVLAMSSAPTFNPAIFVGNKDSAISSVISDSDAPLINRAISSSFPAGSIFKVIVATAALETKKINLNTSFLCEGKATIGRKDFACWDVHGMQSVIPAIAHSCNVFFYRTGLMAGPQPIYEYAVKFGLSHNTSFELPYETGGFIPSPLWRKVSRLGRWFDGDTANLSIGQGDVLVTPLQIARVMTVFANNGYLVTPYIVKSIDGVDISKHQKKSVYLKLKDKTLDDVRKGLRQVITDPKGTGNVLSGVGVTVAGKTGTAQAPPGQPHAWFVGFFPYKNPKYVICVLLERGGPGYWSCIVAKGIIEKMKEGGLI